ncbi:hotdog fold thioesterase [candidate division GN15 bacterium]|nr:hotdog fold thioesterase [candidate division GN15 bacterium]
MNASASESARRTDSSRSIVSRYASGSPNSRPLSVSESSEAAAVVASACRRRSSWSSRSRSVRWYDSHQARLTSTINTAVKIAIATKRLELPDMRLLCSAGYDCATRTTRGIGVSQFEPGRQDYIEAVRQYHAATPMHTRLGIAIESIEPGRVVATMPFDRTMAQQNGYVHAGTLVTLADAVAGMAAMTLAGADQNILSVNITVQLLRSSAASKLIASGQVIKAGRRFSFCEATVWAADDPEGKPLVKASITMAVVPPDSSGQKKG